MEQIKHRKSSLTLRSMSVLEILGNAIVHCEQNPGHTLFFRFSTNAPIGKERRHPGEELPDAWLEARPEARRRIASSDLGPTRFLEASNAVIPDA
jgi:hypothetical protein